LRGGTRRIGAIGIDDIEILATGHQEREADWYCGKLAHGKSCKSA
jgi:hypothetical protein